MPGTIVKILKTPCHPRLIGKPVRYFSRDSFEFYEDGVNIAGGHSLARKEKDESEEVYIIYKDINEFI